jgi:hypothetical protein
MWLALEAMKHRAAWKLAMSIYKKHPQIGSSAEIKRTRHVVGSGGLLVSGSAAVSQTEPVKRTAKRVKPMKPPLRKK